MHASVVARAEHDRRRRMLLLEPVGDVEQLVRRRTLADVPTMTSTPPRSRSLPRLDLGRSPPSSRASAFLARLLELGAQLGGLLGTRRAGARTPRRR